MSDSLIEPTAESVAEPTAEPTAAPEFSFYQDGAISEGFDKMLGENKSARSHFQKYAGAENPFEAAMNGIKDLNFIAGQKERTRPADDASDEDKQAWNNYIRSQLGVPEKADGYGWERPEDISEDMWNQDEMNQFAEILHKGNVPPETAKELFDAYNDSLRGAPEQIEAQMTQQLQVEREKLNGEFGMDAEKMIKQAGEAANLWGVSQEEAERIGQTAEGVKLLARLKNAVTSDVTSNTQSSNGVNNGANSNYEEQAMAAGLKAVEAHGRGDMANYKKFSDQQSHFNQLHASSLR
jgi:hypothetical protein